MYENLISVAERLARRHSAAKQHMVVALQVRGGHVVRYGVNSLGYKRGFSYFDNSLHAEVDLIRRAGGDLERDKVLVFRFNRADTEVSPKTSKPCPLCVNMLVAAGAGRVIFWEGGQICCRRPGELPVVAADPIALTQFHVQRHMAGERKSLNIKDYLADVVIGG